MIVIKNSNTQVMQNIAQIITKIIMMITLSSLVVSPDSGTFAMDKSVIPVKLMKP